LFIEYTNGKKSIFLIDIELNRPEYERDGNGFALDSEICAYYCIDFINCLESWVNRPDRADIMDRQIKPCEPILNKGFESVNLIRQYSANNPFSLLYCSIIECYKVIKSYYPEFIPTSQINNIFCLLNGKSTNLEIIQKEQTTPTKKTKIFVPVSLSRKFTRTEQENLYNKLINGDYIPKNTNFYHFCAVFGNTPIPEKEKPFEQLKWTKKSDVTKGKTANKVSLLDLLQILEMSETEIKDICKNSFANYKSNNFDYKTYKNKLKTNSEFHNNLKEIVNRLSDEIKEK